MFKRWNGRSGLLAGGLLLASAWILIAGSANAPQLRKSSQSALRKATGGPQLVSVDPLPAPVNEANEADGEMCQWLPARARLPLSVLLQQEHEAARQNISEDVDRKPIRVIRDTYPTYSAVAVDMAHNEMVLQDENLFQILVYDRTANTPPSANFTEPKRAIGGVDTHIEFNCGLYIDPHSGDIYSVTNDTIDTLTIFSRDKKGNVPPTRELHTPHGTFGIAVDEGRQEMYLASQHANSVFVYRKMAQGDEKPLRTIVGGKTQLEDPHGVAIDTKNGWIFVSNHGHGRPADGEVGPGGVGWGLQGLNPTEGEEGVRKGGYFEPPSITVYPLDGNGDIAPLRIIQGPRAQLDWPSNMYYDQENEELFVANDADNSVLVFSGRAQGDAAPLRILKGPKTGLKNPTGIFVDNKHNELVVSSMGNHSATTYRRDASGDTPPLRTIRSGPLGMTALAIGNPGAIAYDFKRQEFLVPN